MAKRRYLDFDLSLESRGDQLIVHVVDSPAGEASATVTWPLSPDALENVVLKLGRGRTQVRSVTNQTREVAHSFGSQLFETVFAGSVGTCFMRSMDEAERDGAGLRIRLRTTSAPELSNVPWEYLYAENLGRFLSMSSDTPIVRHLDVPSRSEPLAMTLPLHVVVVVSSPSDVAGLNVEAEVSRLREATADLEKTGRLKLTVVDDAQLSTLQHTLRRTPAHILHFVGHGGYDSQTDDGVLVFEDTVGRSRLVNGRDLGMLLHDHRDLRLALLNACEGARTSVTDTYAGVAQSLLRAGLPSVVAMQFEISDSAAITFAHEFYLALCEGLPVDAAVSEARKAVFASGNEVEWGTPVLYLRADDATLFNVDATGVMPIVREEAAPGAPIVPVAVAVGVAAADLPPVIAPRVTAPSVAAPPVSTPSETSPTTTQPVETVRTEPVPAPVAGASTTQPTQPVPVVAVPAPTPAPTTTPAPAPAPTTTAPVPPAPPVPPVSPQPPDPETPWWQRRAAMVTAAATAVTAIAGAGVAVCNALECRGDGTTTTTASSSANPSTAPTPGETTGLEQTPTPFVEPDANADATAVNVTGFAGEFPDLDAAAGFSSTTTIFLADGATKRTIVGEWRLGWTDQALFVNVLVKDPAFASHTGSPSQLYRGDGVSFEFGPDPRDLAGNAQLREDDLHVMLGIADLPPGESNGLGQAAINVAGRGTFVAGPESVPIDVGEALDFADSVYVLDAVIPWSQLRVDDPRAGDVFGANFNVSDRSESGTLRQMISTNPDRSSKNQPKPGTWEILQLLG